MPLPLRFRSANGSLMALPDKWNRNQGSHTGNPPTTGRGADAPHLQDKVENHRQASPCVDL